MVNPWEVWKQPLAMMKDNRHLPTLHTREQSPQSELVMLCLQTVKHKTENETDEQKGPLHNMRQLADTFPYHASQVSYVHHQGGYAAVLQHLQHFCGVGEGHRQPHQPTHHIVQEVRNGMTCS